MTGTLNWSAVSKCVGKVSWKSGVLALSTFTSSPSLIVCRLNCQSWKTSVLLYDEAPPRALSTYHHQHLSSSLSVIITWQHLVISTYLSPLQLTPLLTVFVRQFIVGAPEQFFITPPFHSWYTFNTSWFSFVYSLGVQVFLTPGEVIGEVLCVVTGLCWMHVSLLSW